LRIAETITSTSTVTKESFLQLDQPRSDSYSFTYLLTYTVGC